MTARAGRSGSARRAGQTVPRRARTARAVGIAALLAVLLSSCAGLAGVHDAPTQEPSGSVTAAQASAIAADVIGRAADATEANKDGEAARKELYTGAALTAADAAAKLGSTLTGEMKAALAESTDSPTVLAVSQGAGFPRQIIARTTLQQSKLPVLYLLVSPDVWTTYRIAARSTMLPGAAILPFAPIEDGSPAVGDGAGLVITPDQVLQEVPPSLNYPTPADPAPQMASDEWSTTLTKATQAKAKALESVGTLTSTQTGRTVLGGVWNSGQQGALSFFVFERKDVVVNKAGTPIKATAGFTALSGAKTITSDASTSTLEFVVVSIPTSGSAQIVAASDQLYAAQGR